MPKFADLLLCLLPENKKNPRNVVVSRVLNGGDGGIRTHGLYYKFITKCEQSAYFVGFFGFEFTIHYKIITKKSGAICFLICFSGSETKNRPFSLQ